MGYGHLNIYRITFRSFLLILIISKRNSKMVVTHLKLTMGVQSQKLIVLKNV